MIALDGPAVAADMPLKAPAYRAVHNWTGFYLGGHVGYGGGSFGPGTNPLPLQGVFFPHSITGLIGGYQAGYNFQLPNNLVFGAEADVSFKSTLDRPKLVPAPFNTTFDYSATARGRIGYAFGTLLPYVTGGVAWARTHVDINDVDGNVLSSRGRTHLGWTAGAGVEYAADARWSAKLEYGYIDLGAPDLWAADVPLPDVRVDPKIHTVKVGLNYKIWDGPLRRHRVTTPSGHPPLRRPRTGTSTPRRHSFRRAIRASARRIKVRTACPEPDASERPGPSEPFLGWRLWEGGEFYFGPELAQGFGIGGTLGLAGFPTAKRKRAAPNIRGSARSAIPSVRRSGSGANRKKSPMPPINCRASATSIGSRSPSGALPSAISLTAIPTPRIRASIS